MPLHISPKEKLKRERVFWLFGLKIVQPHRCERALPTAEMSLLLKVTPSAGLSAALTLLKRSYNTFFILFILFILFNIFFPSAGVSVLLHYLIGLRILSCLLTWKCLCSPSFFKVLGVKITNIYWAALWYSTCNQSQCFFYEYAMQCL